MLGVTSYSKVLLRIATFIGFIIAVFSFLIAKIVISKPKNLTIIPTIYLLVILLSTKKILAINFGNKDNKK